MTALQIPESGALILLCSVCFIKQLALEAALSIPDCLLDSCNLLLT